MSFCSAYALVQDARWPGMGDTWSRSLQEVWERVSLGGLLRHPPHKSVHKGFERRDPVAGIVQVQLDAWIQALCELPDHRQLVCGSFNVEFAEDALDLRLFNAQCALQMTSMYEKFSDLLCRYVTQSQQCKSMQLNTGFSSESLSLALQLWLDDPIVISFIATRFANNMGEFLSCIKIIR